MNSNGRLGILVDFLSHSTIIGFMSGTAILICLQQLKGMFGLTHFTTKTDVISVMHAVFSHRNEVPSLCLNYIFLHRSFAPTFFLLPPLLPGFGYLPRKRHLSRFLPCRRGLTCVSSMSKLRHPID